jgi:hypothetical protein
MKNLKVEGFLTRGSLVNFVNEFRIEKEDILFITEGTGGFTLFYY